MVDSPAGDHQPVEAVEFLGPTHRPSDRVRFRQCVQMLPHVSLQGEYPDHQSRVHDIKPTGDRAGLPRAGTFAAKLEVALAHEREPPGVRGFPPTTGSKSVTSVTSRTTFSGYARVSYDTGCAPDQ